MPDLLVAPLLGTKSSARSRAGLSVFAAPSDLNARPDSCPCAASAEPDKDEDKFSDDEDEDEDFEDDDFDDDDFDEDEDDEDLDDEIEPNDDKEPSALSEP